MNISVLQAPVTKRVLGIIAAVAVVLSMVGFVAVSSQADAATFEVDTGNVKLANERKSDLKSDMTTLINYGLGFVGLIAVAFIIYGGFTYIIAGGEQDQIDKAKNILIYAIVGLIVVLLAFVIVSAIGRIL